MASIEVAGDTMTIHITGLDRLLAFKHSISVALGHIIAIDQDLEEASIVFHGLRMPGTGIPGVVTAGSFRSHGAWSFWDVHDPTKAVIVRLRDEHYARLVVGVDDPAATVRTVREALTTVERG